MIYIVIWEDRHADVEVIPFFFKKDALEYAKAEAKDMMERYGPGEDTTEHLSKSMVKAGWCYYCCYSSEGDSIRVVEKDLK
jgi:hypothetical protein